MSPYRTAETPAAVVAYRRSWWARLKRRATTSWLTYAQGGRLRRRRSPCCNVKTEEGTRRRWPFAMSGRCPKCRLGWSYS